MTSDASKDTHSFQTSDLHIADERGKFALMYILRDAAGRSGDRPVSCPVWGTRSANGYRSRAAAGPNVLVEMLEEQRKQIARELHDDTAQSIALLSLKLTSLMADPGQLPPAVAESLKELDGLARAAVDSLGRNIMELRPGSLDQGLAAALHGLAQQTSDGTTFHARMELTGEERPLGRSAETMLFRIAQEAVHNSVRHSGGTEVEMALEFLPGTVRLTIKDNGAGFAPKNPAGEPVGSGSLGLIGMKERAHSIGASFHMVSRVGEGTRVVIELPFCGKDGPAGE